MKKVVFSLRKGTSLPGILIAILLITVSSANAEWTIDKPPNINSDWDLVGIQFISSNEGWAVGHDSTNKRGVLLHYLNEVWESITPPDISSDWGLEGVDFISFIKGWAVGHRSDGSSLRGLLLKYTCPNITVSPTNIAFHPDVTIGALLDRTVRVSNNGSAKLIIAAITSPSLPFIIKTDNCSGQTLAPPAQLQSNLQICSYLSRSLCQ